MSPMRRKACDTLNFFIHAAERDMRAEPLAPDVAAVRLALLELDPAGLTKWPTAPRAG
jgi:hypothetical protein